MIVVNKFELYREFVCEINVNTILATITQKVISNTFHYDFDITIGSPAGIFNITNTQQLFTLNKTNCFIQSGYLPTNNIVMSYSYTSTSNIQFFAKQSSTGALFTSGFNAFINLQVYF